MFMLIVDVCCRSTSKNYCIRFSFSVQFFFFFRMDVLIIFLCCKIENSRAWIIFHYSTTFGVFFSSCELRFFLYCHCHCVFTNVYFAFLTILFIIYYFFHLVVYEKENFATKQFNSLNFDFHDAVLLRFFNM